MDIEASNRRAEELKTLTYQELRDKWNKKTSNIESVIQAVGRSLKESEGEKLDLTVSIQNLTNNVEKLKQYHAEVVSRLQEEKLFCGISRGQVRNLILLGSNIGLEVIGLFTTLFVNNTEKCPPPPDCSVEEPQEENSGNSFSKNIGPILIVSGFALGKIHDYFNVRQIKMEKMKTKLKEILLKASIIENTEAMIQIFKSYAQLQKGCKEEIEKALEKCEQVPALFYKSVSPQILRRNIVNISGIKMKTEIYEKENS